MDANRLEYDKRVNRVIDHVRDHLSEEMTLASLAQVATFSPFHFHRVVLITPTSPKLHDLLRDGRYALQTFPQPKPGSDEFYVTGKALLVDDPATRAAVFRDAKHMADESETLFELAIDRVMHTRWENVLTPEMRSVHQKWRAP